MNAVPKTFRMPDSDIFGQLRDAAYPAPKQLAHISIAHSGPGIEELVNFYCVVLNMRLVFRIVYPTFEFIAISHDDENHRIGFVYSKVDDIDGFAAAQEVEHDAAADRLTTVADEPRHEPLRKCRIEHTSWEYHTFEEVLMTAKRIHQDLGIWPRTARHQGGGITIDYADPDGNRIELLNQAGSQAQILFGLHKAMGHLGGVVEREYADTYKPFSMEKMIALYEAGHPVHELKSQEACARLAEQGLL